MYTTLRSLKERLDVWLVDCEEEDLSSRTGAQSYLKRTDKTEHEDIGTCTKIEISQDADNADQQVTWFPKVHKHTNVCGKPIFNYLSSQVFIHAHILQLLEILAPWK